MQDQVLKQNLDSVAAVNKSCTIPNSLSSNGYVHASFDDESLFTNVPLKRSIDFICSCIYLDKLVTTKLKEKSLRKLKLGICVKTTFCIMVWSMSKKMV